MNREYDVAVVGATGAVGEAMISILEERNFPVRKLYLLASARSAGKSIMFHGKSVRVTDLAEFDLARCRLDYFLPALVFPRNLLRSLLQRAVW